MKKKDADDLQQEDQVVESKKITGIDFAELCALNDREIFYIKKRYKSEQKTCEEWIDALLKDNLITEVPKFFRKG